MKESRLELTWIGKDSRPRLETRILLEDPTRSYYEPDFVVETSSQKLLRKPKRAGEMQDPDVQAKACAAVEWCRHATEHETTHGGKPWSYLLIPHDAIAANVSLKGLIGKYRI